MGEWLEHVGLLMVVFHYDLLFTIDRFHPLIQAIRDETNIKVSDIPPNFYSLLQMV